MSPAVSIYGIAVDWIGRRIFWCDYHRRMISMATLDRKKERPFTRLDSRHQPLAVAVDPIKG